MHQNLTKNHNTVLPICQIRIKYIHVLTSNELPHRNKSKLGKYYNLQNQSLAKRVTEVFQEFVQIPVWSLDKCFGDK